MNAIDRMQTHSKITKREKDIEEMAAFMIKELAQAYDKTIGQKTSLLPSAEYIKSTFKIAEI